MFIHRLTPVLFGIMLSGGLISSAAAAQPTVVSNHNAQVQHLTCVQDTQGLMCKVDASSNTKSIEQVSVDKSDISAPELITTAQLGQISDLLLGIMYFGLPSALVFAVLLHDKRAAQRTQLIAQLERTWQNPQS